MTSIVNARHVQKIVLTTGFLLVTFISGNALLSRHRDTGAFFNLAQQSPWYNLQVWVRDHIPINEPLVTPIYLESFRSYSLHNSYGDYKDGGSHLFCPTTIFTWWNRMQSLGLTLNMKTSLFPLQYHQNAIEVARAAGILYVVYDKNYSQCRGPVLYQNDRFGVFAVSDSVVLVNR